MTRLARLSERRLVDVGDHADDAEGAGAFDVLPERADVARGGDQAAADRVLAREDAPREASG